MRVEIGILVALGYGKYFRADSIVGLEPLEEGRGPGRRTQVYVQGQSTPIIASRSEGVILRDMTEMPREITRVREQQQLLADILDTIHEIDPVLRSIVRDQGKWDLNKLEDRIKEIIEEEAEEE